MKVTESIKTRVAASLVALLLAMASLAVAPGPARAAATWNVPGDFPTIQAAIDGAAATDTILVAPGTYVENLDYNGKDVRVASSGGAAVTTLDANNDRGVDIGPGGAIIGFTITNARESFGAALEVHGDGTLILENVFDGNLQGGGGFGAGIGGNSASPVIDSNVFTNNSCDTQHLSGVIAFVNGSDPVITNNVIYDNPCRAINLTLPATADPSVINNTITGNPVGLRLNVRAPASHVYRNNLIYGNEVGVLVEGDIAVLDHNLVFDNTTDYSGIADQTGSNGNISADPLLANPEAGDVHLTAGSPAIDAGGTADAPSADFEGDSRPLGAGIDIGADEYPSVAQGISGLVTHSGATPIDGLCVTAFDIALSQVAQTVSARTGRYELGLDPGDYLVEFSNCGLGIFFSEWYDNQPSSATAATLSVAEGQLLTGIDAALAISATCNGLTPTHLGTAGDDLIIGTSGADVIMSLAGNDVVRGAAGNDTICGGGDDDVLIGGSGDDSIFGNLGADTITGVSGNDSLFGGGGTDTLSYETAIGQIVVDLALGTATGAGSDAIANFENVIGSPQDDILKGDSKGNRIEGRDGNDTLWGRSGKDILRGGAGADKLRGGAWADILIGGSGADNLGGGTAIDSLFGNSGNDILFGNQGDDSIRGAAGDDLVLGGPGADTMDAGGDADDTVSFEFSTAAVTADLDAGTATGEGSDTFTGATHLVGSRHDDTLLGDSSENFLYGLRGGDTLWGRGGSDVIVGGPGHDSMRGGAGNDLLAGEIGNDTMYGGSGFDAATWQFAASAITADLALGTATGQGSDVLVNIEDLIGSDDNGDRLTGDGSDNLIYGLGGNDQIFGRGGPDGLFGGVGNDVINGESGNDFLNGQAGTDVLNGGTGLDECREGESHTSCEVVIDRADSAVSDADTSRYVWPRNPGFDGARLATFAYIIE